MSTSDITAVLFLLLLLVGLAQLFGYIFVKLRQPKLIGEILAGIVLGPALLGQQLINLIHQKGERLRSRAARLLIKGEHLEPERRRVQTENGVCGTEPLSPRVKSV